MTRRPFTTFEAALLVLCLGCTSCPDSYRLTLMLTHRTRARTRRAGTSARVFGAALSTAGRLS